MEQGVFDELRESQTFGHTHEAYTGDDGLEGMVKRIGPARIIIDGEQLFHMRPDGSKGDPVYPKPKGEPDLGLTREEEDNACAAWANREREIYDSERIDQT